MGRKRRKTSGSAEPEEQGWKRLAWRGLSFSLPESWDLGSVSGDNASGYLRIDDPFYTRLEAKWMTCARSKPSLERVYQDYLSQLKGKGKTRRDVSVAQGPEFRPWGQDGSEECRFRWESDAEGSCLIRFFGASQRVLFLQVMARKGQGGARLAERIFETVRDDSDSDRIPWAVYDVMFSVPREFHLESHGLQSGLLDFGFVASGVLLGVKRWSMADAMLRRGSLETWLKRQYGPFLKGTRWESRELPWKGHAALQVDGGYEVRGSQWLWPLLSALPLNLGRRIPLDLAGSVCIKLWHCPESNRVFGVHLRDPDARTGWVEDVAGSLCCHDPLTEVRPDALAGSIEESASAGQEGYLSVHSGEESVGGVEKE